MKYSIVVGSVNTTQWAVDPPGGGGGGGARPLQQYTPTILESFFWLQMS